MDSKKLGSFGENIACYYLGRKGYKILDRNYSRKWIQGPQKGEIDIVARHKDYLVFVEVRTKTSLDFGTPEESITPTKMKHFERTAAYYQQTHENLPALWRIDLVAVELGADNKPTRIEVIENAFE